MTNNLIGGLGAQIANVLRQEIVAGVIPHGERLIEAEIAARFDVSRGPVRDALRDLAAENLVEVRRRSMFALRVSADDIEELFSLRLVLERLATARMLARRDSVDWSGFTQALGEMRAAAEVGDSARFGEADLAFHDAVYRQAGHRRLLGLWSGLAPTIRALLRSNASDRDLHPSVTVHERLLELLRASPLDVVLVEVEEHLELSQRRLVEAIERS